MNYFGNCKCETWAIRVAAFDALGNFSPRVCDCEYCQAHPSALISHRNMRIELAGDEHALALDQNGDRLASFYHCATCADLLAVGCEIAGRLRGAVNALLLDQRAELGEPVAIQPRLLAASEKLARWEQLWGELAIRASGGVA
ncbi:MAG TPA: hypothetical protein VFK05_17795 [Polyangiaceae bacterium]|nr:hypothetical protein [Polyangiaceae bacterium]